MTRSEFEQMVQAKAKIMTLWTKTAPALNAEGKKKFPGLIKLTKINCITGYDYVKLLDKYQTQNDLPKIEVQPRKWGVRDGNLVRHNGKTYIPVRVNHSSATYKVGDQEIAAEEVYPFMRSKDGPPVCEYNLDNVVGVTVDGDFHLLRGDDENV